MSDEIRAYRKRRRAEAEARTRLRITESAVRLHGTLGPARTTVSAVARGAGVRRSTVYRHFPDESGLIAACSAHWAAANPPPDIGRWLAVRAPDARTAQALGELYAYYRRAGAMLERILRDEAAVPVVRMSLAPYRAYLAAARDALLAGRRTRGRARAPQAAAIGHALAFATWRSLAVEQALDDAAAAALMCRLIAAAGRPAGRAR